MRDFQRQRLYNWELAHAARLVPSLATRFETLEECAEFVSELCRRIGSHRSRMTIGSGCGRRRGCGGPREIKLPTWTRSAWYIAHEVAHGCNDTMQGGWHGPKFCRVYAALLVEAEKAVTGKSTVTVGQVVKSMRADGGLKVAGSSLGVRKRVPKSKWHTATERIGRHHVRLVHT